MIVLAQLMNVLAKTRPIFHSEADFQHALAWEINHQYPDSQIRLEYPIQTMSGAVHLDIWLLTNKITIALELKYKTHVLITSIGAEIFRLRHQSAQDIGRYDYLKDIHRLENVVSTNPNTIGYALFLTNENSYWKPPQNIDTVDREFRIDEGRTLGGRMRWGESASKGTTSTREVPIVLEGNYKAKWNAYSQIENLKYGVFKYLKVEVKGPGVAEK